jgi:ribosomal protein S18 acetylase RimI-like enzyme
MADAQEFHYYCRPPAHLPVDDSVSLIPVTAFLADEPACRALWNLLETQFKTRSKFLAIWRCVSYVAMHRTSTGDADGFLLISAPVNWQIDYVVVHPDSRGQGIASKLVTQTVRHAGLVQVPYVMLTSKPSLRPMYESCGFRVVNES